MASTEKGLPSESPPDSSPGQQVRGCAGVLGLRLKQICARARSAHQSPGWKLPWHIDGATISCSSHLQTGGLSGPEDPEHQTATEDLGQISRSDLALPPAATEDPCIIMFIANFLNAKEPNAVESRGESDQGK